LCARCDLRDDLHGLLGGAPTDPCLIELVDALCASDRPESIIVRKSPALSPAATSTPTPSWTACAISASTSSAPETAPLANSSSNAHPPYRSYDGFEPYFHA
jgi:hypothetical protein